mgnify:CR=1 FL=1
MLIKEIRDSALNRYVILNEVNITNSTTNKTFNCARGFVTDYASTSVLKFDEAGQPAALMHDVDYWFQSKSRMDADIDFKDNLIFLGVSKFKAYAYYFAVRISGWKAWRDNKNQRVLHFDKNKILSKDELKKFNLGEACNE